MPVNDDRTRAVRRIMAGAALAAFALGGVIAVPAGAQARDTAPLELKIGVPASAGVFTAGETITVTFTARNAGNSAVTLPEDARVVVEAVQDGPVTSYTGDCAATGVMPVDSYVKHSGEFDLPPVMQVGEMITCTTTYTPTADDVAAGGIFGALSYQLVPNLKEAGWKYYTLAAEGGSPTPVIASTAIVGKPLTVKRGFYGWWNEIFEYTWLVDGKPAGRVGPAFTPTDDELGSVISVRVAGMSEYGSIIKTSNATAPAVGKFTAPTPRVIGNTRVGSTLTAIPGIWTPSAAKTTYQWYRASSAISGATNWTYKLTAADKGRTVKVKVTGAKPGYPTLSKVSLPTTTIDAEHIVTATPKITGTTTVGRKLTATAGAWRPASVTLTYRWYRDNSAIKGATKPAYLLTAADRGKTIKVKVTASKTGYTTVAKVSQATAEIR
ncbi:hypothetical protein [Microbacterium terricola]|nr:hypothetical protein [Microbacterium terricola]UYK41178.1 hypothetical protein OAU46_05950 [Microbacterium terricola]